MCGESPARFLLDKIKIKRTQHGHRVATYVETRCSHPVDWEYLLRRRMSRGPVFLAEKSQESLSFQQAHRQMDGEGCSIRHRMKKSPQPRYTLLCSSNLLATTLLFQFVLLTGRKMCYASNHSLLHESISWLILPQLYATHLLLSLSKTGSASCTYLVPACVV